MAANEITSILHEMMECAQCESMMERLEDMDETDTSSLNTIINTAETLWSKYNMLYWKAITKKQQGVFLSFIKQEEKKEKDNALSCFFPFVLSLQKREICNDTTTWTEEDGEEQHRLRNITVEYIGEHANIEVYYRYNTTTKELVHFDISFCEDMLYEWIGFNDEFGKHMSFAHRGLSGKAWRTDKYLQYTKSFRYHEENADADADAKAASFFANLIQLLLREIIHEKQLQENVLRRYGGSFSQIVCDFSDTVF